MPAITEAERETRRILGSNVVDALLATGRTFDELSKLSEQERTELLKARHR